MRSRTAALLVLLGLGTMVVAQETEGQPSAEEIFVAANQAYELGDFETAISGYEDLGVLGVDGGSVHFNLGNAYLRNGELGRAIAELRRSRNLMPRDRDVRANLSFARQSARDAIAPPEASPVLSTLLFWHYSLSRSELAAVLVIVNILFWGVAGARLFYRESEVLRWILIGLLVTLVAVGGSVAAHQLLASPVAVVVPQEIDAYSAPDSDSVVRFKLHAGTEVSIKDEREEWLRIALPDNQQAWIERSWAEVVAY